MTYEDLRGMDLRKYQVPLSLSKKLFMLADGDEEFDNQLLEAAQHALLLEDLIQDKQKQINSLVNRKIMWTVQ